MKTQRSRGGKEKQRYSSSAEKGYAEGKKKKVTTEKGHPERWPKEGVWREYEGGGRGDLQIGRKEAGASEEQEHKSPRVKLKGPKA